MSEKQYKVGYFEDPVNIDDYVETIDGEYLDATDAVKLLNKLSNENEQLKEEINYLKGQLKAYSEVSPEGKWILNKGDVE